MALTSEQLIWNLALGHVGEYQVTGTTPSDEKQYELCDRYYDQSRDLALKSHPWNEAKKRVIIAQDADEPIFGYDRKYTKPTDALRILSVNDSIGSDQRNRADAVKAWEVEGDVILSNAGETPQTWATSTKYVDGEFVSTSPRTWVTGTSFIDGEFLTDGTSVYEVLVDHTSDTIANDVTAGNLGSGVVAGAATYEVATTHTSDTVLADLTSTYLTPIGADYRIVFVEYIWKLTDTTKFSAPLKEAIGEQLAIKIITGLTNDTRGKIDLINKFEKLTLPKARSVDGAEMTPKPIFNSEWIRSRTAGTRNYWG